MKSIFHFFGLIGGGGQNSLLVHVPLLSTQRGSIHEYGRTDSAITKYLPKYLWGHNNSYHGKAASTKIKKKVENYSEYY